MLSKYVLAPICFWGLVGLPAQGVVNPTLLRAPDGGPPAAAGPAVAVAKVGASVVYVCVEIAGPRGTFPIVRSSTGVIVDGGGLILTWKHLVQEVEGASDKKLLVQLNDAANTRLPASIVRLDAASGLALLRVEPPAAGLRHVEFGADRTAAGESVVVVSRPEGKEMLAFAGVASPALAAVLHRGVTWPAEQLFLTDTRNDERCDGALVVDGHGSLMGLYGAEHVQRDKSEPTLEDLRRPSFGVVVPVGVVRKAFAAEFAAAGVTNTSLRVASVASPDANAAAVARVAPAVVSVWAGDGDWPVPDSGDPGAVQRRSGLGSGVVLGGKGLVVTNAHLVAEGTPRIRTRDGRTFTAKVLKAHGSTNLALLQVELPSDIRLTAADCDPDDDAVLGEAVLALGNPFGRHVVVTGGVVSARRPSESGRIQADANLGNANAGGAVIDRTGRLLGIADGGAIDPLEWAYRTRGDRITTETNLSTFVGIRIVRRTFASQLESGAEEGEPIRQPSSVTASDRAQRNSALTAMVAKASSASLNIVLSANVAEAKPDDLFPPEPNWQRYSLGSGVVIDRSGLALSNWHVVDDATGPDGSSVDQFKVEATVFGGKTYPVRVLSISRENDLSLLQLELAPGEELQAVELGNSGALAIGDMVAAIGNPHGRANTITFGVVSAKDQFINVKHRFDKLGPLLETDAAINGGNSGGALLDMQGRLVGINSAGGGTFNNKGYAIEVDHVRQQVLGLLLAPYKLRSPDLGMRVIDDEGKVVVMDVDDRGPAAKAGVRSGDRILALGGTGITWSPGFARELLKRPADVEVELRVDRKGEQKAILVAPWPAALWSVLRQSNLRCRTLGFRDDPERVRAAAIALHRHLLGDSTAEPAVMPEFVVRVDQVFERGGEPIQVQKDDLLMAIELLSEAGHPVFVHLDSVEKLRDLWNDRLLGEYGDGVKWKCLVARGGAIQTVDVVAKRLFW